MRLRDPRRRIATVLLALVVVVAAGILAAPGTRHTLLRAMGRALVAEDPVRPADIVIVSTDSLAAGILEAAKLVEQGMARRVAVFERDPSPLGRELMLRGLPRLDLQAYSIDLLHALGITDIEMIPAVVGTLDEGQVLQQWCTAKGIRSVLFVSMSDHSRRTRRVLGRALVSHGIAVMVRWARLSQFDPDTWWQTRTGQRVEIVESQKLLVDILRHPF